MVAEVSSRLSSKTVIGTKRFLKVLPMLIAGLFFTNTLLSTFGIDYRIFSYLASVGILPWVFIMAASYMFRFCEYHRMFLWYVLANNIVCWADAEFGLPISNWNLLILHFILAGITLFLVLFFWIKCKRETI